MLAGAWLLAASGAVMGGVALPLPARIMICAALMSTGLAGIRSGFLFRGRRALARILWSAEETYSAVRRCDGIEVPAVLAKGSFRLGQLGLFLWFSTREGRHGVFIDSGVHDFHELRRLCQRLRRRPRPAPDERQPPS